jgi:hypothetical protein
VLGALGEDPDGAGQRRRGVGGAPVVVGDNGLDAVADRGGVEPRARIVGTWEARVRSAIW